MTHKTIAVIGHVDHGKTALVRAITGVETDTLAEERARGLTLSLGFAHRQTPTGQLHLIDAPGHADFVRTTVSGLSGVDAVLLAVSARDGAEAQTREHLDLAWLMGIQDVIVALTKSDLADADLIDKRRAEMETLLDTHAFETRKVIVSSTRDEEGMQALIASLESYVDTQRNRPALPGFYLPIDRVFTSPGTGTVVTGTLIGRAVEPNSAATLAPAGLATTVRGLQVAGSSVQKAEPGSRVAMNLRGLDAASIRKGDVICAPGTYPPSDRFDVALRNVNGAARALKHMDQVIVMWGTQSQAARVRFFAHSCDPVDRQYAQLEFPVPQIGFRGQPFVLRNPVSATTLCGGTILDPVAIGMRRDKPRQLAVLKAAHAGNTDTLAQSLADRGNGELDLRDLARLSGESLTELSAKIEDSFCLDSSGCALRRSDIERASDAYLKVLAALHASRPIRPAHPSTGVRAALRSYTVTLLDHVEDVLQQRGEITVKDTYVAHASHAPFDIMSSEQRAAYDEAAQRLAEMALRPDNLFAAKKVMPDQDDLIDLMISQGIAVRLQNHALRQRILLHVSAIDRGLQILRRAFPPGTQFTTGEARAALKTNRKIIVPLLEHFDLRAMTRRDGDLRSITT